MNADHAQGFPLLKLLTTLPAVVAIILSLTGCERAPSKERIIGTYKGTLMGASEVLELRKDGTFTQKLTIPSGETLTHDGKWELKYKAVILDTYLKYYDEDKITLVPPRKVWGIIYEWSADMLIRDWHPENYTLKHQ